LGYDFLCLNIYLGGGLICNHPAYATGCQSSGR